MLGAEPLAKPVAAVPIDGAVRPAHRAEAEVVRPSLLVTLLGEGSGCPYELKGGSAILAGSALIPGGQPQGGRHAGCRTLAPARARAEDDLHPLLAAAV